jgi:hypothetical protein
MSRFATQPGGIYGGYFGNMAGLNPLMNPAFKIPGGESPYKQPVLPKEESPEENIPFFFPGQPQLPAAGIGNVGGLIAQQPQNNPQDVSGFEKLLEGMEEQKRLRIRGADQMQVGPNQFVSYPMQRRPF